MRIISLIGLICLGCGPDLYVNGHAATPDEYDGATAVSQPKAPHIRPVCEVKAADVNFATIFCRYAGNPSMRDWREGLAIEVKLAAQTAVLGGKSAIASIERGTPDVRLANYTSPRACTRSVNGLRAFGAILAGAGGAYQDHAQCNSAGGDTTCTFTPAQARPDIHDTQCVGGETTTYVAGVATTGTWRFLTDEEAHAPTMALLPREKQPLSCEAILNPDFTLSARPLAKQLAKPSPATTPPGSPLPEDPPAPKWVDPFVN